MGIDLNLTNIAKIKLKLFEVNFTFLNEIFNIF